MFYGLGVVHESLINTKEDIISHNIVMAFAYVLALAAHKKDRLSMLDWGGGIGHYYLLAQALIPDVEIEYHCKDVPVLCKHGEQLFPNQHFYADNRCFDRSYDFILASSSIHYSEEWQNILQRLAGATRDYLYIANIPIVQYASSFVFVQRPYPCGYNTEYLAWCLNRAELLKNAECSGLDLLREFVYGNLWSQYRRLKNYAQSQSLNIYNATKGGLLDVFDRVDYDSLFPKPE